jgi:hypothetical protein
MENACSPLRGFHAGDLDHRHLGLILFQSEHPLSCAALSSPRGVVTDDPAIMRYRNSQRPCEFVLRALILPQLLLPHRAHKKEKPADPGGTPTPNPRYVLRGKV